MKMSVNYYKNIADSYDKKWKSYTDNTLEIAIQHFPESLEGKTMLDFGCGTGELIRRILEKHPNLDHITGYDPVEEMLHQARKKIQHLPGYLRDKVKMQNQKNFENKYDLIVSTSVFHYLQHPDSEMVNLKAHLQKDGMLILLDYIKSGFLAKYFEWAIKRIDNMLIKCIASIKFKKFLEEQVLKLSIVKNLRLLFSGKALWFALPIKSKFPDKKILCQ
ncbi:ubiquinone/menaquinone biosynthesis C-methylase UbiE [Catalinimonas alkaloidigena]|uniref:class I SAM-dependent DNA methyltransferase n=1 Tax=Catalinimonas alkaloidigena TaxID=1075417 RepID=UPI002404A346|nr:class I SAM-dependent methyltransferase [Catalinimonas alkaloidigena]MDF9799202.1 ubiquinone/menaquinone biosynthesis C-methylase UbiE [Catalinimonas alkaloidigena]